MRRLLESGTSGIVTSPVHIRSLAVWPTFLTAASLWEHEKHSF